MVVMEVDAVLDLMRMTRDAKQCSDCGTKRVYGETYYPSSNLPTRAVCGACKSETRRKT